MNVARSIWVISCLMGVSAYVCGQAYIPFPLQNAIWTVTFNSSDCILWQPELAVQTYRYAMTADTLIGATNYRKLAVVEVCATCCEPPPAVGYVGALRDDTVSRAVFIVPPDSMSEVLLYDFAVAVGDTIEQAFPLFACSPQVVHAIDSLEVNGTYRRRYHLQGPCWPNEVVEGIGSLTGPLEWAWSAADVGGSLACLEVNGVRIFSAGPGQCDLQVGTTDTGDPLRLQAVALGDGRWSVALPSGCTYTVYDMKGGAVLRGQPMGTDATVLDLGPLAPGIYPLAVVSMEGAPQVLKLHW